MTYTKRLRKFQKSQCDDGPDQNIDLQVPRKKSLRGEGDSKTSDDDVKLQKKRRKRSSLSANTISAMERLLDLLGQLKESHTALDDTVLKRSIWDAKCLSSSNIGEDDLVNLIESMCNCQEVVYTVIQTLPSPERPTPNDDHLSINYRKAYYLGILYCNLLSLPPVVSHFLNVGTSNNHIDLETVLQHLISTTRVWMGGCKNDDASPPQWMWAAVGDLFSVVHRLLMLYHIPESAIIQIITTASDIYTIADAIECVNSAEDVLVAIFSTHESLRPLILQTALGNASKIVPKGRNRSNWSLGLSSGKIIHRYSALLLRLNQSVCLPPTGAKKNMSTIIDQSKHLAVTSRCIAQGLLSMCVPKPVSTSRKNVGYGHNMNKKEMKSIAMSIISDICDACDLPEFPCAVLLIQHLSYQLIILLNSRINSKVNATDMTLDTQGQEGCMQVLGSVAHRIFALSAEARSFEIDIHAIRRDPDRSAKPDDADEVSKCICGEAGCRPGSFMFDCEDCHVWFHGPCMGFASPEDLPESWCCGNCLLRRTAVRLSIDGGPKWASMSSPCVTVDVPSSQTSVVSGSKDLDVTSASLESINPRVILFYLIVSYIERCHSVPLAVDILDATRTKIVIPSNHPIYSKSAFLGLVVDRHKKETEKGDDAASTDDDKLTEFLLTEWNDVLSETRAVSTAPFMHAYEIRRMWKLVCAERLEKTRDLIVNTVLHNVKNADRNIVRCASMSALSLIISADPTIVTTNKYMIKGLKDSLNDSAPRVRERCLNIIGQILHNSKPEKVEGKELQSDNTDESLSPCIKERITSPAFLRATYKSILTMTYDISPAVRGQAVKIIGSLILTDTFTHLSDQRGIMMEGSDNEADDMFLPSVISISDRASNDGETGTVKDACLDTLCLLWYTKWDIHKDIPSPVTVDRFTMFINHIGTIDDRYYQGYIFEQLSTYLKKKGFKCFDEVMQWWLHHLQERYWDTGSNSVTPERQLKLLTAIRIVGEVTPNALESHVRFFTPYLKTIPKSVIDGEMLIEVCKILGLASHIPSLSRQTSLAFSNCEKDLTTFLVCRGRVVRAAIHCLCQIVSHHTYNYRVLQPIFTESLKILYRCRDVLMRRSEGDSSCDTTLLSAIPRHILQVAWLFETIDADNFIDHDIGGDGEDDMDDDKPTNTTPFKTPAKKRRNQSKAREAENTVHAANQKIPLSELRADILPSESSINFDDIVHSTFTLFCDICELSAPDHRRHPLEALGIFLKRNRGFVRSRRMRSIIHEALYIRPLNLCTLSALRVIHILLEKFEKDATSAPPPPEADAGRVGPPTTPSKRPEALSATASAQPLSLHVKMILKIISETSYSSIENDISLCYTGLRVIELLNRQGLVNPTTIIGTTFALLVSSVDIISGKSFSIIQSICDTNIDFLLNSLSTCMISASRIKMNGNELPGPQTFDHVCDFYAQKLRHQKGTREKFILYTCRLLDDHNSISTDYDHMDASDNERGINKYRYYLLFVSALLCRLPYIYEGEVLSAIKTLTGILSSKVYAITDSVNDIQMISPVIDKCEELTNVTLTCIAVSYTRSILGEIYQLPLRSNLEKDNADGQCHTDTPTRAPAVNERIKYDTEDIQYGMYDFKHLMTSLEKVNEANGDETFLRELLYDLLRDEIEDVPLPPKAKSGGKKTGKRAPKKPVTKGAKKVKRKKESDDDSDY
eukprot:GHVO01004713.1.p1 GENE.GHVO01004713.1~~GHVO01004713.1.p1  ORF type:complete len:1695 (+),score=319.10 GHVO01004713.1:1458-6542(+)